MIQFHVGLKGIGKTKRLIDAVNTAINEEKGNVVCITRGGRLIHDINRGARLINTEMFDIKGFEMFSGFICGIISRDFDITHIFIDSIFKSVGNAEMNDLDKFVSVLEKLDEKFGVSFTIMVTADEATATENVRKYMV